MGAGGNPECTRDFVGFVEPRIGGDNQARRGFDWEIGGRPALAVAQGAMYHRGNAIAPEPRTPDAADARDDPVDQTRVDRVAIAPYGSGEFTHCVALSPVHARRLRAENAPQLGPVVT
ncbi:hypothetical protein HMP06_3118 [Sphingomonas sp. HMP6]|nr:hypothetical protein HMP06_3118 [Sphingomonas sp. HMP6]